MFDLIGKTIGPYRILEQVGAGGMATVYKAYQPSMDRYIAVKVLPAHLSRDPDFTKRFQREARAISRLEHSRILPVYDYGEYEGITYIAMRYIKAGTLKDQMSVGGLSLDEINRLISQIGGALDYAHRMGVIHRDVKPANILIDDQGDVYLSDFGLARIMEPTQQLTESGVGLGTPAYMSPEQGQGIKVDHRSDIYSLGVILYEMLTGRVPYEAETPMAVVFQHIHGDLPIPHLINPTAPEAVERIVLKALAKDPADRYQTAGEMAQALNTAVRMMGAEVQQQTFVDQVMPVQQDTSIGTRLQRIWDQPHGKIMFASGALLAVMLLGFLLFQLPGNITILAPNPENTPVTGLETQAATLESSAQNTSSPVTTTVSLATQQVQQPASTLTSSDYGSLLYEENFDQDTGRWALDKGSSIQDGQLIIPPGASARPFFDAQKFSDFIFETEFHFLEPNSSVFSVYLRYQDPPCPGTGNCSDQIGVMSDGYLLAWRPNGTNSSPQILASTGVPQLDPNEANRLTIFVNGDEFRIYVNGIFVRSFRDSTYESGIFVLDADHEATAFNHVRIYAIPSVSDGPSLPAPQGNLVFDENFDDGIANRITPNRTNWEIVDDNNGGKLFQIDGKPAVDWDGFGLGSITIVDGTIEYKVRVVDYDLSSSRGAVICNFRVTPDRTYLFDLAVGANIVSMNYQSTDTNYEWRLLDDAQAPHIFDKNKWYEVRIDVKGNEFTAYIDGKKVLSATDEIINSGEINFRVEPNTVAQLDDLRVWIQP